FSDAETVKRDQVSGKVVNSYLLAHVEHKCVANRGEHCCLEHQLHCLGNRHEIARGIWVRHRQRPPVGKLMAKEGYHAAATTQYVAKTNRDVAQGCTTRRLAHRSPGH